jgi:hypothetical protein
VELSTVPVFPPACQQLVVRSALDDLSVRHDDDAIGVAHGGEAVRDDQGGPVLHQALEGFLHQALRLGVEGGRRLVEDQDGRVLQDRARDREPLALSARESDTEIADTRLVPRGSA